MQALRVMTFNLRRDIESDGDHAWPHREEAATAVVRRHRPHLLGTQEGLAHQLASLDAATPGYARVGGTRCGRGVDEANALYVDTERLLIEASGDLWLSDRPHEPGSIAWGAACPRMATWAHLLDRATGTRFTAVNTHLDHVSGEARQQALRLIEDRFPNALVMGDFNARPATPLHRRALRTWEDTHASTGERATSGGTFHAFTGEARNRIDWILVPRGTEIRKHAVILDTPGGRFPSDHWPVVADVTL